MSLFKPTTSESYGRCWRMNITTDDNDNDVIYELQHGLEEQSLVFLLREKRYIQIVQSVEISKDLSRLEIRTNEMRQELSITAIYDRMMGAPVVEKFQHLKLCPGMEHKINDIPCTASKIFRHFHPAYIDG